MVYWKTPEELGMNEEQITAKLDELMSIDKANANKKCPDCGVSPTENHKSGCDVARCQICKMQALSCDCEDVGNDVWDGLWPGTQECYDNRLLVHGNDIGWSFDYNTLAVMNAKKNRG